MMMIRSILHWLETRWVVPAYAGWVLGSLVLFFFGAATNTMAGWLYVMSGTMLALLAIAASLPPRLLRSLIVVRPSISPVMAGDPMTIRVTVQNSSAQSRELLQLRDPLPKSLEHLASTVIEHLKPHGSFEWVYEIPGSLRGVHQWHTLQFRTAAPLGLFWCQRDIHAPAKAIVYPTILPLDRCPLLDQLGQDTHAQCLSHQNAQQANDGLTRAIRPYRWGDPTRLIHWRTSARYGELRVRELEVLTSSPSVVIAIDTAIDWDPESFEQAAIAACSLYDYACRQQMNVSIWTAEYGMVHMRHAIYEVLAAMTPHQGSPQANPNSASVVWLTQFSTRLDHVAAESYWLLWSPLLQTNHTHGKFSLNERPHESSPSLRTALSPHIGQGHVIYPDQNLQPQLSAPLKASSSHR